MTKTRKAEYSKTVELLRDEMEAAFGKLQQYELLRTVEIAKNALQEQLETDRIRALILERWPNSKTGASHVNIMERHRHERMLAFAEALHRFMSHVSAERAGRAFAQAYRGRRKAKP